MPLFEVGDFLEVRENMHIDGQNVSVSYCMVIDSNLDDVVVEFYDEERLSAGTKTMSVGEIRYSDKFQKTNKEPHRIAWEFRKSLGE